MMNGIHTYIHHHTKQIPENVVKLSQAIMKLILKF